MMNLCGFHYGSCFTLKAEAMSAIPLSPVLIQPHTLFCLQVNFPKHPGVYI